MRCVRLFWARNTFISLLTSIGNPSAETQRSQWRKLLDEMMNAREILSAIKQSQSIEPLHWAVVQVKFICNGMVSRSFSFLIHMPSFKLHRILLFRWIVFSCGFLNITAATAAAVAGAAVFVSFTFENASFHPL